MFGLEALDLARMQFAFTVSFHILFPAITIGLASFLAVLEGLWLKTGDGTYRDLYHFWSKIFAVIGVVSIWTPLTHTEIAARWFSLPNLLWFMPVPVPILVLRSLYGLLKAVARRAHYTPFLLTLVLAQNHGRLMADAPRLQYR